jgi:protein SCO1/2
MRPVLTVLVGALLVATACSRSRTFELHGQVLAVDPSRREITIKHEDIRGFMPGMTMAFKVKDARLMEGRTPGDLVAARLVVNDNDAYLAAIERTGHAPLTEAPPEIRSMDVLAPGDPVPDARFTDASGAARTLSEWRGKAIAVTFVYTRCPLPDFCPRMDRNFAAVQREILADARLRDRVTLLSVSFDPAFDTPAVLAEHARRAGADPRIWRFVTGERDALAAFASRFGVSVIRGEEDAGNITHNLRTAVVGPDGRIVTILNGNEWTAAELIDALRRASA